MQYDLSETRPYREEYYSGLQTLIETRRRELDAARAVRMSPEAVAANRETFREEYIGMLGWPLTEYEAMRNTPVQVRRTLRGENEFAQIWQMQFEVLPDLWLYGLFFEHKNKSEALPFVICQHGGGGTPERISGVLETTSNYNRLLERTAQYGSGAHTFAPGLFLWMDQDGPKRDRPVMDRDLKQLGSSVAAVEVFAIRRALDWFEDNGFAREGHIGMVGLSYGGSYSLLCAAADTRICAAYSSCQYNDRYLHNWVDWTWQNSARMLDAEMAALVAPRALFLDAGDQDPMFKSDSFLRECGRAARFYEAAGVPENLRYAVFAGAHEFNPADDGLDFVFRYI